MLQPNNVASSSTNQLIERLEDAKRLFGPGANKPTERILSRLAQLRIKDPEALISLHEALLFVAAYPQSIRAQTVAESMLNTFAARVAALREAGVDLSSFEPSDISGISGTSVTDTFSYYIVRWLQRRHSNQIEFDWDEFEDENRLAETWPRFMPLLEEDAAVEANVSYRRWLKAARGRAKELPWLIERFDSFRKTEKEKAELYDSQNLYTRWTPAYRSTRTGMRVAVKKIFYHREPLIRRRDVSMRDELLKPPPAVKRLSARQGEAILDLAREASTVRYRELYGFTHGDPKRLLKIDIGRGVDIFVMGVPPDRRLPLRAYHAAMIFKNGVPIGYFEGLSLFERMESGFNLYYTFRDGETAWLYARTLNIFHHLLGIKAFSIDPYQIGYENEEGIDSGAFWFYRKLGFRPMSARLLKLAQDEEAKITRRRGYRTSPRVLRRLAKASMIFELDESRVGDWDRFQVRNLGLKVQRRMAERLKGEATRIRDASVKSVARVLGIDVSRWSKEKQTALSDFSVVLSLIHDLGRWENHEKQAAVRIIEAKAGADEARFLRLMQRHERLRAHFITMGSS